MNDCAPLIRVVLLEAQRRAARTFADNPPLPVGKAR